MIKLAAANIITQTVGGTPVITADTTALTYIEIGFGANLKIVMPVGTVVNGAFFPSTMPPCVMTVDLTTGNYQPQPPSIFQPGTLSPDLLTQVKTALTAFQAQLEGAILASGVISGTQQ